MVLRQIFLILSDLSLVSSPVGHVGIYVVSQSQQDFLDAVRIHVNDSLNLLLAQIKSKLLESFDIERVPIIGLLTDGVRLTIVVHVDHLGQIVLNNLSEENTI